MPRISTRWVAVGVFALYSALNFLNRQVLASVAPQLQVDFRLTNEDYGWLQAGFSITYAVCAPFVGLFIDRVGLTKGAMLTIGVWSLAGIGTAMVDSFAGLLVCRVLLGIAQAGGIPAFSKSSATFLEPRERALGGGVNQLGISAGSMAAPLLAGFGWRVAFLTAGTVGLLWIPLWRAIEKIAAPKPQAVTGVRAATPKEMIRDSRLWALMAGNFLVMTGYSLWTNWTTIFLVQRHHLSQTEANLRYAWIPPLFAIAGGSIGGWMAMRWMAGGASLMSARSRSIFIGTGVLLPATMAVPFLPDPLTATAMVSLSFFCSVAVSTNVYALAQDLFGAGRAAFAVASITFGYGLMQTMYSPLVGRMLDRFGFEPVCVLTALTPLAGWAVLRVAMKEAEAGA